MTPRTSSCAEQTAVARINALIDEWHDDAANARQASFDKIADEGTFIGTDRTERWNRETLGARAAEYVAKPSAWVFTPLRRNVVAAPAAGPAWFDEQLSSCMGVLQATEIVRVDCVRTAILHDQLSVAIPNSLLGEATRLVQSVDWP